MGGCDGDFVSPPDIDAFFSRGSDANGLCVDCQTYQLSRVEMGVRGVSGGMVMGLGEDLLFVRVS